jgi:hypothetical protein
MFRLPNSGLRKHLSEFQLREARLARIFYLLWAISDSQFFVVRQSASAMLDEYRLRSILIACLLTTSIEVYQGNYQQGLNQAATGIKLLRGFLERRYTTSSLSTGTRYRSETSIIGADIIETFSHLEDTVLKVTNASIHKDLDTFQEDTSAFVLRSQPSQFDSLKKARIYWNINCRRAITWSSVVALEAAQKPTASGKITLSGHARHGRTRRGISLLMRTELQDGEGHATKGTALPTRAHSRWAKAFQPLFDKCWAKPKGSSDFRGATLLMIKHLSVLFLYSNNDFDNLAENARWLIDMARQILEHERQDGGIDRATATCTTPTCNFDDSIVLALFIVATRCRHRLARREAIALLQKHPRREGLWDSEMAANVAQWFVDIEEEGLCGEDHVPSGSRLAIVRHEVFLSERKVLVQCSKQGKSGSRREHLPTRIVVW